MYSAASSGFLLLIYTVFVMLVVSAAYYVGSSLLSPGKRRTGVYACGEEWRPVSGGVEPPYPVVVLVFAVLEPIPLVVYAFTRYGCYGAGLAVAAAGSVLGFLVAVEGLSGRGG